MLKDCIGKDLSRIALPVNFNEPTSFLQRLAEDYQYAHLLEKVSRDHLLNIDVQAALARDPMERLMWVCVFAVTPFASANGRTYKPFNPLLGETYELIHRGFLFQSEQVGHHPPVTAYHTSGKGYKANGHLAVVTKFTGKSLEVNLDGPSHYLINHPDGHVERYSHNRARLVVNNVIFGKMSMDVAGSIIVTNHATGDYGIIEFPNRGWWSSEVHPVRGAVASKSGTFHYKFDGVWSHAITVQKLNPNLSAKGTETPEPLGDTPVEPLDSTIKYPSRAYDFAGECCRQITNYFSEVDWAGLVPDSNSKPFIGWQSEFRPHYASKYYQFGFITFELNEISELYDPARGAPIPRTDSRFRPDQRALEFGDTDLANAEKLRLEEKQR